MAIAYTASLLYSFIYAVVGYAVPAYYSFKAIERKGGDDIKEWTEYWVVLSALYCFQWLIDFLLCWLPLYFLAKLGFIVALWHPSTHLSQTIYRKMFSPLLNTYEADIDKMVVETKTRGVDIVGQHAGTLKVTAQKLGVQASSAFTQLKTKTLERARSSKAPTADATHGLHSE